MIQGSINQLLGQATAIIGIGKAIKKNKSISDTEVEEPETVENKVEEPSPADIQKKKAEEELKAEQERIRQGREAAREQILLDTPWSKEKVQMEREEAKSKILDLGKGV